MTGANRAPAVCLLLLISLSGFSQTPHADFKISMDVNLVVLGVIVLDQEGRFVSGLKQENFRIYENGAPQDTKLFLPEDVPVTVGLVVDSSGSMGPKRAETVEAVLAFMNYSNPEDEMFVIRFNEKVFFGLPESRPFTSEPGELRAALTGGRAIGRTALYDAIAAGIERLERGTKEKKILVVFSDGGDNASRYSLGEALRLAEQSHAIIYTIGLFNPNDPDRNPGVLKRFAKITGADAYLPGSSSDITGICQRIARDIRNQYTVGYAPGGEPGTYRTIKVTAQAPNHRKLRVRTRTGYAAPATQ